MEFPKEMTSLFIKRLSESLRSLRGSLKIRFILSAVSGIGFPSESMLLQAVQKTDISGKKE